jgi:hypothetical protein
MPKFRIQNFSKSPKENPYLNSKKEKIIKSSSQATKNTDKDKSSPLGCLILIILILIVWMIFK